MKDNVSIVNLRFTYKNVPINILEKLTFRNIADILLKIYSLDDILECIVLQTCNRIEIYAISMNADNDLVIRNIAERWKKNNKINSTDFFAWLEKDYDEGALNHLLRLISGLESMIVGEDQILGQVRKALIAADNCGTVGTYLKLIFEKAIKVGIKVRLSTKINNGTVSVGSAAIKLLETKTNQLEKKKIIIIGAGDTGCMVGKALHVRKHPVIFVANRTFKRGVRLAKTLGGYAVKYNNFKILLAEVDIVIVTTRAPHYILTEKLMNEVVKKREGKQLIIMDLSNPRNVEESICTLPGILLYNIDDLKGISNENIRKRTDEISKAEKIINEEFFHLKRNLKYERVKPVISALTLDIEKYRVEETQKALKLLIDLNDDQRNIINNLTKVLIKRIMFNPLKNIKNAALKDDLRMIQIAQKLFKKEMYERE